MFRLLLFIFLTSFTLESSAQLCSGSLGDPVATIDFGNGSSGFGLPLPSGKTNYNFLYNSCPLDGQYTITSATISCFNKSWHSITNDHTPDDIGGFFMLVNASVGPGVFYVDTVNTLCDNTTYEFSSYIINMTNSSSCGGNPISPNLTFTIETEGGQLLTKYNTGNIAIQASPEWKQYGTYITTPANAGKIIIKIINNAPGGCGNDLALDDIVFRPCGPKVELSVDGKTTADVTICSSSSSVYTLGATFSAGFIDPQKQWQSSIDSGNTWQNIVGEVNSFYNYQPSKEGMVLFRLLIGEGNNIYIPSCRIASSPIKVTINPSPTLQLTKNLPQCTGSTITLNVSGTTSYQWVGPNGFNSTLQNPIITNIQLTGSGMYYVTGTNSFGCTSTDSVVVNVSPPIAHSLDGKMTTDTSICLSSANKYAIGATFAADFIDPQKQWQSSVDSGKTWQNIVGEVNNVYQYQPSKAGTILFRLLISEGNNVFVPSCRTLSSPIKVTINPIPTLQLTKNLPQCAGSTITLNVSGTTSYQWVGPNGFNSTLQNPIITNIQLTGSGMYYVTGTNSYGCTSTDSVVVNISLPIAHSLDGKMTTDTSICLSSTNKYAIGATFAADFIDPQKQWQSSVDSGKTWQNIVGEINNVYQYQPSKAGTILFRLLISEGNNVFVPSCRTLSSPIKVTINPSPTLQLTKNLPQCAGSTVALNVSGTTSYQWVGPNGFNSTLQNPTIANIQPSNSGTYYVTGSSIAGCKTIDSITIQIFPPIQATINPALFGCVGDSFQLFATGGIHYKWTPAITLNNDTISNPIANPTTSTQYAVTITDQYGCSVKITTQVKISKIPVVDAGPDIEIVRGDSVQLMARITGIDFHYSWLPTNYMANPNSLQPFVRPQNTQRYMLTAISDSGCGSSTDAVWVTVIEAIKIPNTFTPNGDGINDQWVMANIPSPNNFIVEIYTATGQMVYRKLGYNSPWDGSFNGKKLPPGTYYYVLDTKLPRYNKIVGFVTLFY